MEIKRRTAIEVDEQDC